jgi:cation diffusion facilitator CzcD-associated flavoprotein CzcO
MAGDTTVTDSAAVDFAAGMPELPDFLGEQHRAAIMPARLPGSLDELAALALRELDLTRYPMKSWALPKLAPDGSRALDVLVVGAGQAGLAAGFGLLQQRVDNILLIDENAPGREGPWGSYARMETLRTQKDVGGIEAGIPSLSLRAWFEVQYGARAWDELYKVPTEAYYRYLNWYRQVTRLPVRNLCRLVGFGPSSVDGVLRAEIESTGGEKSVLFARTLVLATGIEGNGRRQVPAFISETVPKQMWAHTHEAIDFDALKGKKIAALGGGASAFDNAILAAENGAARVDLYYRTPLVRPANAVAWGEFNGYLAHFPDLAPLERWRFNRQMKIFRGGPPLRTIARAERASNLAIHPGVGWKGVRLAGGRIELAADDGAREVDFLILGTGYTANLGLRPEFADLLGTIALWQDVFTPPAGEGDAALLQSCFLGPNFELTEKRPGNAPWLASVFNFSRGANLSMGSMPIGLSGIKFGVPRLVHGVTKRLFVSDAEAYFTGMKLWQQGDKIYEP